MESKHNFVQNSRRYSHDAYENLEKIFDGKRSTVQKNEELMKATKKVRELINDSNLSLSFFSKQLKKTKFKVQFARKNKEKRSQPKKNLFHQQRWKTPWNRETPSQENQMIFWMKKSSLLTTLLILYLLLNRHIRLKNIGTMILRDQADFPGIELETVKVYYLFFILFLCGKFMIPL